MKKTEMPWIEEYKLLGIPETYKPYPEKPVYEILYNTAKEYQNMGVIQSDFLITYPEIKDHVDRLASALSQLGLVKGDRVFNKMKDFIPDTPIEDLRIPYAAVAVDLINQREVVFREGSLFDAIRASVSIPSVLTPVRTGDGLLVDGGVLNNIPTSHAPRIPGDLLVVANVNARIPVHLPEVSTEEGEKQRKAYQKKIKEFYEHLHKILPQVTAEKQGQSDEEKLGYFHLIDRTISLMTYHMAQMSLKHYSPDVLIEVSRDSCGTYDFFKADQMVAMGREAAAASLDRLEANKR